MSSLVNKSGVRFTPKSQRRSVASTPAVSRRASVTPSIDNELKKRDEQEQQEQQPNSDGSDNESEESEKEDALPMPKPSEKVRRRSSVAGPLETKQRRLSTLSNTSRLGFLNRKNSLSAISKDKEATPVAILQKPEKRNSVDLSKSRKSISEATPISKPINILTPPATQQDKLIQSKIEKSLQENEQSPELPATPLETLSKSEAKAVLDVDEEQAEDKVSTKKSSLSVTEDTEEAPGDKYSSSGSSSQAPNDNSDDQESETPPSSADSIKETKSYLIYRKGVIQKVRSVTERKLPEDFLLKCYDELANISKTLQSDQTNDIRLDETEFKMSDLCKPSLPFGRTSSNYDLAKKANASKRVERIERRQKRQNAKRDRISLEILDQDKLKQDVKKLINAEDLLNAENVGTSAQQSVQLKLGQDGNMIIDEESRVVDRHKNVNISRLERQDENPFENLVNSGSYGKQRYSDRWDDAERELLYRGLYQWGTDFGLIAQTFPYRNRRQIKSKFLLEEKKNPHLVELALSRKLKLDEFSLEKYSKNSNKTFDELEKFNEKILGIQKDHEKNLKELSIAKEKAKEEDLERQRKQEQDVRNGWDRKPKTRKERMNELKKHETVLGSLDDIKKTNAEDQVAAQ